MNPTHLHLLLNHIPILGSAFGALLLLYGIISKNKSIINTSLIVFLICAIFTIPVFLTGEPAEESVENIVGISKATIEAHEEGAELAMWLMQALGVLSFIAWLTNRKENRLGKIFTYASLFLGLITFGFMVKVGSDGGEIRHTEISGHYHIIVNPEHANDND